MWQPVVVAAEPALAGKLQVYLRDVANHSSTKKKSVREGGSGACAVRSRVPVGDSFDTTPPPLLYYIRSRGDDHSQVSELVTLSPASIADRADADE